MSHNSSHYYAGGQLISDGEEIASRSSVGIRRDSVRELKGSSQWANGEKVYSKFD